MINNTNRAIVLEWPGPRNGLMRRSQSVWDPRRNDAGLMLAMWPMLSLLDFRIKIVIRPLFQTQRSILFVHCCYGSG
jgi:hypothetical protein